MMPDGVALFSTIISWFLTWLPVFVLIGTYLFLFWNWKRADGGGRSESQPQKENRAGA
jgi:hypothetical protein